MLVKFTNSVGNLRGMPIYLNSDQVISVFEIPQDGGSLITVIFCNPGREWYVEEGLSEAVKIINGDKK